ncbi:hypothetical protein NP493_643g04012 [Ridgeia piscesae]|uniref:DNA-binding protein SMUBP-2 n=1 Tax=Ridgeia piscesae TaxID=27915 RepID=A0AAD9KSZ8_RIDPI|nr:hypothetical protein NP493_643g04012 [Ridgeia piscesae]
MDISVEVYVAKTLKLLEYEREAEIQETSSLQEHVSAKELQQRGVCLLKLRVSSQRTGLYGRTVLTLEPYWPGNELPAHNFTPGDIAGLSLSKGECGSDTIASGIVTRVSQSAVSVAFEESYDGLNIDDSAQYKLVKLANDVTYRRLKKTLQKLATYRSGCSQHLIDVLFGQTDLGPAYSVARDGDTAQELVFFNPHLDASQREAVGFALRQREVGVIHGPPGTGKTTTIVEVIRQAVKQKLKILACAPSNIAVDNLLERLAGQKVKVIRLGHPARLLASIQRYSLDAILAGSDESKLVADVRKDMDKTLSSLKKARDGGARQRLREEMRALRKELRQREDAATRDLLKRADVVMATLTGASDEGPLKQLEEDHFDIVIVDECSQAMEAACWQAMLHAPRCILAGDHNQLPPTIISNKAAKEGLAVTLMERVLKLYKDKVMRMLTVQYRMNDRIMQWSSDQLYDGKLVAHESVAKHLLRDLTGVSETEDTAIPLLLIDTAGCHQRELQLPDEVSKGNEGEADLVTAHVDRLISVGVSPQDIAVIAPYNLQVELLRLRLSQKYPKLEIKSVDGFQGREKEAVVISFVRSNEKGEVGFLALERRINVAITRARRHLAVICDSETVSHNKFLKSLVEYLSEHGDVRSAEQYIQEGVLSTDCQRPERLRNLESSQRNKQTSSRSKSDKTTKKNHKNAQQTPQDMRQTTNMTARAALTEEQPSGREVELQQSLVEFHSDSSRTEHAFPASLNSHDRYLVHEIAERLGLVHLSRGEGIERHIVVSKPHKMPCLASSVNNHDASSVKSVSLTSVTCLTPSSDDSNDSGDENVAPPRAERATNAKKKPKSAKKPKNKALDREMDDDFDAVIAAAMKENVSCAFTKCPASTATLGQNCPFCARRFCLRHHIPEVHGCGDKAKARARALISRDGVLYPGSGVPSKKPNARTRAHLQQKLEKKLTGMEEQRRHKKKEK